VLDEMYVLLDVLGTPTGDFGDLSEIPSFVVKILQFARKLDRARSASSKILYKRFQMGLLAGACDDFSADVGLFESRLRDEPTLAADQLVPTVLGEKLIVHANIFDLTNRLNALHIHGKLRFIASARVNHLDL